MVFGREKRLLSGEEIINLKTNTLKDIPSGCKDYAPDNSWLEQKQIQAALESHHVLVGTERIEKKSNLSQAVWVRDVGKAKVTKKTGKHWEVFGHNVNSEDWLWPEEALFLLETNALELYYGEVPLSIEQTYSLVIGENCSIQEYRVYSHLSKKGYKVLRHDKEITITNYEKAINLEQINLAEKRSAPLFKVEESAKPNEKVQIQQEDADICETSSSYSNPSTTPEEETNTNVGSPANGSINNENCDHFESEDTTSHTSMQGPIIDIDCTTNSTDSFNEICLASEKSLQEVVNSETSRELVNESSPDVAIIEDEPNLVIEIEDDEEIMIIDVKNASHIETVDISDSDEDDDVIYIGQNSSSAPLLRRKWFMSIPEFVSITFPENPDKQKQNKKHSKIKMIDYFDLANKSIDTIMKAIPKHDGAAEFINSPDQRFIPESILPRCAHYKINLRSSGDSNNFNDSSRQEEHPPQIITSESLSSIYGREAGNRNTYGYSFHRTRNYRNNYNPFRRGHFPGQYRNRAIGFRDNQRYYDNNYPTNQNDYNHDNYNNDVHDNFNAQFNNFNPHRQGNFINQWYPNQDNGNEFYAGSNMNHFQNNQQFIINPQLEMALQSACRMQVMAMNLMRSSQDLMQNFNNPNIRRPFPQGNFNNFNQLPNQANFLVRPRRPYHRRGNFKRRGWLCQHNGGGYGDREPFEIEERASPEIDVIEDNHTPDIICLADEESADRKFKPSAAKRCMALGAIVNMNTAKRPKIIETSEVNLKQEESSMPLVKNEKEQPESRDIDYQEIPESPESVLIIEDSLACTPIEIAHTGKTCEDHIENETTPEPLVIDKVIHTPMEVDLQTTAARKCEKYEQEQASDKTEENVPDTQDIPPVQLDNADQDTPEKVDECIDSWKMFKEEILDKQPAHIQNIGTLLNCEDDRISIRDVLNGLQVSGPIDETETLRDDLKVTFDIYLPNQPFRKSVKLLPKYRVVISRQDSFPTVFELNHLTASYKDEVPFIYAVVFDDSIGFYNLQTLALPTLIDEP